VGHYQNGDWTEADEGVSSMREISRQEVQELMKQGALVVDVLPVEEFQDGHRPQPPAAGAAGRPRLAVCDRPNAA
jgi:rhodanese-related sulfurtransferase